MILDRIKIPLIIITGPHSTIGTRAYKEIRGYPFLDFINKEHLEFKYEELSSAGRDADIKEPAFKLWWDHVKSYYLSFDKLPADHTILAYDTPRSKTPIAWCFDNLLFVPGYPPYKATPAQVRSSYRNMDKKFLTILVRFILTFKPTQKLPKWYPNHYILNEKELLNQRKQLNKEFEELQEIKKIIATSGTELQNAFSKMLTVLGIKWEQRGAEDFLIPRDPNIVIEITGTKHNLNRKKAIQSLQHQGELMNKIKGKLKLCVIINHQREKKPNKRDKLDRNTIRLFYEPNDICVISTVTLLKYYKKILGGEVTKEELLQKIASTAGELK